MRSYKAAVPTWKTKSVLGFLSSCPATWKGETNHFYNPGDGSAYELTRVDSPHILTHFF